MFSNVLVPLDGSPMAESALPAARYLSERLGATINLLHVIEKDAPPEIHGQPHLQTPDQAQRYLSDLSARALPAGARIERHVHAAEVRNVPQSIEAHATDLPGCLVVMSTHGRSGLGNLLLGNIAQRVLAEGLTPVLLVPPNGEKAFALQRLLVPLDGEEVHERGLPIAEALARACGAETRLLRVVPTARSLSGKEAPAARYLPRTTRAILQIAREEAQQYLDGRAARLTTGGLRVTTELGRGKPDRAIVEAGKAFDADLIILATHRKAGMEAFWADSVAPRVATYAMRPVLLVPVAE